MEIAKGSNAEIINYIVSITYEALKVSQEINNDLFMKDIKSEHAEEMIKNAALDEIVKLLQVK